MDTSNVKSIESKGMAARSFPGLLKVFATKNRTVRRWITILLAVSIISVTVHSFLLHIHMSLRRRSAKLDVILVYADSDVCAKWTSMFPGHTILINGYPSSDKRNNACYYLIGQNTSLDYYYTALKFDPEFVYLVEDSDFATQTVINAMGHRVSRRGESNIVYHNRAEPIFNTVRYWGCGGDKPLKESANYSLCPHTGRSSVFVSVPGNTLCNSAHPPMTLGKGVYFMTSSSCVLLHRSVFWLMPFVAHSMENKYSSKVALSMVAQKLLWASGSVAEVGSVHVNTHFPPIDVPRKVIGKVAAKLAENECTAEHDFISCSMLFLKSLEALSYLNEDMLEQMNTWLKSLSDLGYNLPAGAPIHTHCSGENILRSFISTEEQNHKTDLLYRNKKAIADLQNKVCSNRPPVVSDDDEDTGVNKTKHKQEEVAPTPEVQEDYTVPEEQKIWLQWKDTLLIVVFNRAVYNSIPYYETLYRRFFPNILYCGPKYPKASQKLQRYFSFSFVSFGDTPEWLNEGSLNYQCLAEAFRLGYDVSGYLLVADDAILMPHLMQNHNTNQVWASRLDNMVRMNYANLTACDDTGCHEETEQYWLQFKNSTLSALRDVRALANSSAPFATCAKNIAELFGGPDWTLRILSDVFYVPTRFIPEVTELFKVFRKNEVYLEIAIPTVLHCVVPQNEITPIYTHFHNLDASDEPARYSPSIMEPDDPHTVVMTHRNYTGTRECPWNHINARLLRGATFYHPHKMGILQRKVKKNTRYEVDLFCNLIHFYNDPQGNLSNYFK